MLLPEGLYEGLQTLGIKLVPLLIADTQILKVEWGRMPHLSTETSPFGRDIPVSELNQVEGILDIWLKLINRDMGRNIVILELARQTDAYDRKRL